MDLLFRGARLRVTDRDLLGQGGEADVYRAGDLALKVFHRADAAKLAKVRAFPRDLPAAVVGPIDVLRDGAGDEVGYAMPVVRDAFEIRRLSERAFRDAGVANREVSQVFRALAAVVDALHERGVFVGDLNDGNVLVAPGPSPAPARAHLIDADSLHLPGHPCTVAHERFLDPRLFGRDLAHGGAFDAESDRYALAALLFQSLLFVHPYGGVHPAHPTLLRRAEARCSALREEVKLPRAAVRADVLPDALRDFFERVFENGERPPLAPALLDARWSRCRCGLEHARPRCPACTHTRAIARASTIVRDGRCTARRVLEARGRIVAFAVQRGAAWVVDGARGLEREDGSPVGAGAIDLDAKVALAGRTTWIVRDEVAIGLRDGREIARLACARGPFGPAFDASEAGAFRVHGDHVLDERGRRIASCPGGLAWLRVGGRRGVAVYRVGRLARAVLFRTDDAGGRDVALPPDVFADAKVVSLDATFDERHALLGATLGRAGKVEHATMLFDERAELLAIAHGAPGEPLAVPLRSCALAGGRVVCADASGLALLDVDRAAQRFVERARFPDAAPFVAPEDAIFAAPGGALFVVGPRSVDELSLG